jgi:hypothetical protein
MVAVASCMLERRRAMVVATTAVAEKAEGTISPGRRSSGGAAGFRRRLHLQPPATMAAAPVTCTQPTRFFHEHDSTGIEETPQDLLIPPP